MVMGISTNTRLLSMAIVNDGRLIEHSIRLYKSSWSARKANMMTASMEACVRRYSIKKAILSIPPLYHQTRALKALHTRICRCFEINGIPVETGSHNVFYKYCTPGQRKSKKPMMQAIAYRFPRLHYFYRKELKNKRKYYIKLFEAVAMALHQPNQ